GPMAAEATGGRRTGARAQRKAPAAEAAGPRRRRGHEHVRAARRQGPGAAGDRTGDVYVWSLRRGVGVHARHLLLAVGFGIAAGDRPGHETRDAGSGLGRFRVDLRQPVGPEFGDVEEDVLAGVDPDGPRREVVLVELFAELHGFEARDPARLVERVVVVEREIVLLLLVNRDPELFRTAHHGRVAVGHEVEQLH